MVTPYAPCIFMRRWLLPALMLLALLAGCGGNETLPNDRPVDADPAAIPTAAAATPAPTAPNASAGSPASEDSADEGPLAGTIPAPAFPDDLDWLNVSRPLTLAELRGKVVLLDFWTYGCINCMHVIPELKRLEEKYADSLVVIGVHSAKFDTEGETENIRRIIQRYELAHPVINDRDFAVWRAYGAEAWPTFVLIDPDGNVLGYHSGEGIYDLFDQVIGRVVADFDALGRIDRSALDDLLARERAAPSPLLFPGKVLADTEGQRLFIADSNHHRIVVTDFAGRVLQVIGSGAAGLRDGDLATAQFFRPQGMALEGANTLYVADTGNHSLRRVYLDSERVTTVAGNGEQSYLTAPRVNAWETGLNSPWDLLYHNGIVYIAMAGQHQIWAYDPAQELIYLLAGSGREALLDGAQLQAGLNQPSGLATDGERLFVADAEASAIRSAGLTPSGSLATLVGVGLFDFGDVDGTGDEVRLQHPLDVSYGNGLVYIADTYNQRIKALDPATRTVRTLSGGGTPGWRDGADALFDEPGGLAVAGRQLFVADTNNHVIRVVDLEGGAVRTLVLVDDQGLLTRAAAGVPYAGKLLTLPAQQIAPGGGTIVLDVALPAGYKINDLAPFAVDWSGSEGVGFAADGAQLRVANPSLPLRFDATFPAGAATLAAELVVYYCESEAASLCLIEQVRLVLPLEGVAGAPDQVTVTYAVPPPE